MENDDSIPKLLGGLKFTNLIVKSSVKCTLDLVTGGGIELTIIALSWRQVVRIVGLESMYHHVPKLLATTAKMRLHRSFPKVKVSSIIMGSGSRMVNMRHA